MDLNAVQMFVSVVQAGSLSAAATRLGIPLPTLSRRIRELENQLKVQLLERSTRGTTLTDAGARLYEHASRGIEMLIEGGQALMSDQARLKGRLRLSLPPAFQPWWELLSAFQHRHPDIRLQVYTTERRVDLIADGIDVALRVGAISQESLLARRVLPFRNVLVASPELIQRKGLPRTPDDLVRFPCAVWCPGNEISNTWLLGEHTIEPSAIITTNDYAHLYRCAIAGDFVTELPPFLASKPIREGKLIALLPEHPLPEQQVNHVYVAHRIPSTIIRAYLDFCESRIPWFARACGM